MPSLLCVGFVLFVQKHEIRCTVLTIRKFCFSFDGLGPNRPTRRFKPLAQPPLAESGATIQTPQLSDTASRIVSAPQQIKFIHPQPSKSSFVIQMKIGTDKCISADPVLASPHLLPTQCSYLYALITLITILLLS